MEVKVNVGFGPGRPPVRDHRPPQHGGGHHGGHNGGHHNHHPHYPAPRPPVYYPAPPVYYPVPVYPSGQSVSTFTDRTMNRLDRSNRGIINRNDFHNADYRTQNFLASADSYRPDGWVTRAELRSAVASRVDTNYNGYVDHHEERWAQINFGL